MLFRSPILSSLPRITLHPTPTLALHRAVNLIHYPILSYPILTPSYHLSSHPYTSTAQGSQPHTMLPSMGAYNYAFSEEERHKEQPVRPPMNAPNPKGKTFKWVPNRGKVRVHTCVLLYTAPSLIVTSPPFLFPHFFTVPLLHSFTLPSLYPHPSAIP